MSVTEAAACGTPAVATRIAGHEDAVVDGRTGVLVDRENHDAFVDAVAAVVGDVDRRDRLGDEAARMAARRTWGTTAVEVLRCLADEAVRRRSRPIGGLRRR